MQGFVQSAKTLGGHQCCRYWSMHRHCDTGMPDPSIQGVSLLATKAPFVSLVLLTKEAGSTHVVWSETGLVYCPAQGCGEQEVPLGSTDYTTCILLHTFSCFLTSPFSTLVPPFAISVLSKLNNHNYFFCLGPSFAASVPKFGYRWFWYHYLGIPGFMCCFWYGYLDSTGFAWLYSQKVPHIPLQLSVKSNHFLSNSPLNICEIQPCFTVLSVTFVRFMHCYRSHPAIPAMSRPMVSHIPCSYLVTWGQDPITCLQPWHNRDVPWPACRCQV